MVFMAKHSQVLPCVGKNGLYKIICVTQGDRHMYIVYSFWVMINVGMCFGSLLANLPIMK